MQLRVRFSVAVEKFFVRLSQTDKKLYKIIQSHVLKLPEVYKADPFLKGSNYKGMRKHRVGDYRIIYRVLHDQLMIYVIEIGHRREVYDR